jgi:hypothetical protein
VQWTRSLRCKPLQAPCVDDVALNTSLGSTVGVRYNAAGSFALCLFGFT